MVGVGQCVRERDLRPVGRSPQRELVDAERLPDRLDVCSVLGRLHCGVFQVCLTREVADNLVECIEFFCPRAKFRWFKPRPAL